MFQLVFGDISFGRWIKTADGGGGNKAADSSPGKEGGGGRRREAEGGGGLLLGLVEKADRVENLGVTQGMIQKSRDIFCQ